MFQGWGSSFFVNEERVWPPYSLGCGLKVAVESRCYFSVIVHNSNLNSTRTDLLIGGSANFFILQPSLKINPRGHFQIHLNGNPDSLLHQSSDRVLLRSGSARNSLGAVHHAAMRALPQCLLRCHCFFCCCFFPNWTKGPVVEKKINHEKRCLHLLI